MAVQTYSGLSAEQRTFYVGVLIKRLLPRLVMFHDAQKRTVPLHQGGFASNQIQFRKFAALPLATTPLTEGTPPNGSALSMSTVLTSLAQYGDIVEFSDILVTAGIDPDITNIIESLLGEQAGQTLHSILITELKNLTTTQIANGKAARADLVATDVLTSAEIKKAVRTLEVNKVPRFPDGFYHGLIGPYGKFDLSNDDEWEDIAKNWGGVGKEGGPDQVHHYVGHIHGVMFRESTEAPEYTGPTTYGTFVYGPEMYGCLDFVTQTVGNINEETNLGVDVSIISPTQKTKDDPLGQKGVAGWKASFATKILDNARGVLIHHGATP